MSTELAIRDDQTGFDAKQVAALRQLGVNGATNADLAIFFHQCAKTGLDPFARQIHMVGRKQKNQQDAWEVKFTIQTGIDGYRLIARRAADAARETLRYGETLWRGKGGEWDDAWDGDEPPHAAKVTVYRADQPFSGVAHYREYVQTTRSGEPNSMWRGMPAGQLAKCAEALALRKAFPQDLSGIYAEDEMGQAQNEPQPPPAPRITAAQITTPPTPEPRRPDITAADGYPNADDAAPPTTDATPPADAGTLL